MATSPILDEMIRRVVGGDLEAFAEIIRVCQRPVRAWIVSRCPPGGDADDVAQQTFVAAFKRIDDYQIGTDFRAWLFTIARYQLMAECTRLKRMADYHSRYLPHALSQELDRRTEGVAESPTRLTHLRECLQSVESNAREILDLRYGKELPLAEIAERSNRSVAAIKKHLFVLRQKLHDCVEKKFAGEAV
ncbi:sigma-70 family RNA polymerase sigma factor [Stieleria sp. TO1_6]|uniref:RNA polymerase sigma factor n=1 Tax=Stieleria tagensis TaxID=2956795 RepID=UPI00209B009D|nr:sigma-70 family RNA polymerase sigma factor [Stieleria tagensis]MCO8124550.1 sigma-70 family RNA polymerase sigma factor [Stieleria tagensis]